MLRRAFDIGWNASWVTADEVYGRDSKFRNLLVNKGIGYVVAISCQQRLFLDGSYDRVDRHVQAFPKRKWKKLSCGAGSKGQRFYQWVFVPFGIPTDQGLRKSLLVRRSLKNPEKLAYYFTHAPQGTTLANLVRVAGSLCFFASSLIVQISLTASMATFALKDDPKRRRFRNMSFSWLDELIPVPVSSIQENFSI